MGVVPASSQTTCKIDYAFITTIPGTGTNYSYPYVTHVTLLSFRSNRHGDVVGEVLPETTAAVERLTARAVAEARRSRRIRLSPGLSQKPET